MVAVVAVILDHLVHWPSGGFVGVDVFFVISGFLITGILLREYEKTGAISFVGFYRRRVKRIVPAATAVLLTVAGLGFVLFNQARANQTLWDAVASFFFVSNWNFAAAGTDYFQADGPVSPLQHFWSLSVEEQFYFVWPWLMLGLLALAGLRKGASVRSRTITGLVMALIVAATFAWSLYESSASPTVAYFSTLSRAWELGIGALLAIATPWWGKIPDILRPILGWVGLIGIIASLFLINDAVAFPAPWALLPVLSTALVIAAGTGGPQRFLFPLTNPISFYVGNISYSLYLWHFPVIVFGALLLDGPLYYLVAVVLMLSLAIISYHLIEVPIQRSPLLEPHTLTHRRGRREKRRSAWAQWRHDFGTSYRYGSLALAAIIAVPLVFVAVTASTPDRGTAAPYVPRDMLSSETPAPESADFGPEVAAVQEELRRGLRLTSWADTDPTLDYVLENDMIPAGVGSCGDLVQPTRDRCTWGDPGAARTAVLVGDSVAMAWVPSLLPLVAEGEWKLVIEGMYGCPFVDLERAGEQSKMEACVTRKAKAIDTVAELEPELLIVSNTYELPELDGGQKATPASWEEGLASILAQTDENAGATVVLSPPPPDKDIRECYSPTNSPADCASRVTPVWDSVAAAESAAAEKVGATWVDTSVLFCTDGLCPPTTPTLPIKRDITHVTQPYAEYLSPAIRELITPAVNDL